MQQHDTALQHARQAPASTKNTSENQFRQNNKHRFRPLDRDWVDQRTTSGIHHTTCEAGATPLTPLSSSVTHQAHQDPRRRPLQHSSLNSTKPPQPEPYESLYMKTRVHPLGDGYWYARTALRQELGRRTNPTRYWCRNNSMGTRNRRPLT